MATLQPFKEGHHPEQYRVPSLDGKDRCKYTRQIFVQKGQRVKIGEPVKVSFFRQVAPGATLMYEDILYACDDDVCPEYTKDPRKCQKCMSEAYILTANKASRRSLPSPPTSHERTSKKTLNAWIPLKVLSTASTLTFTSRSTDPNSMPSSSARARSWAAALLASDKHDNRILIIPSQITHDLFSVKVVNLRGMDILLDIYYRDTGTMYG